MNCLNSIIWKHLVLLTLFTASTVSVVTHQGNISSSVQSTSQTKNFNGTTISTPNDINPSSLDHSRTSSHRRFDVRKHFSKTVHYGNRDSILTTTYNNSHKFGNETLSKLRENIKADNGELFASLIQSPRGSVENERLSPHPVLKPMPNVEFSNATAKVSASASSVTEIGILNTKSLHSLDEHAQVSQLTTFEGHYSEAGNELHLKTNNSPLSNQLRNISRTSDTTTKKVITSQLFTESQTLQPTAHGVFSGGFSSEAHKFAINKNLPENQINGGNLMEHLDSHNESELLNPNQEKTLINWFGDARQVVVNSKLKTQSENASIAEYENNTFRGVNSTRELGTCSDECGKNRGVCVMGNDFKSHCVVVSDACDQFQCTNGACVSTDGRYKCECHVGWVGTFCDTPCPLDCGDHGYCNRLDGNNTVGCICHWNYTGHQCKDKRKIVLGVIEVPVRGRNLENWEIALIAVVTAFSLVSLGVFLPYILWRRRWITIRKIVFYFQDFEDDDDKEYDAFLSYKSTPRDEKFILQHLYPKLEQELNFKLCLHFRDFPPGEPIANNILRAIEGSRRTILILSPNYISSEWCRMEYQKAQYEMLKLKHKIIPIVFEDISDVPDIDKNLKSIINTVTYIRWPGNDEPVSSKRITKFWKLLELSMPKKKPDYKRSLSSTESCSSVVPLTEVSEPCFNGILSSMSADLSSKSGRHTSGSGVKTSDKPEISEFSFPSTDFQFRSPDIQQHQMGTVSTIPLTPSTETRRGWDIMLSSSTDTGKRSCSKDKLSSEEVTRKIIPLKSSLNNDNLNNRYLEEQSKDIAEFRESNISNTTKQIANTFITSDDHIVEIREGGSGVNGITITPRPRMFAEQLTTLKTTI